jgi:hypothetical protein
MLYRSRPIFRGSFVPSTMMLSRYIQTAANGGWMFVVQ